MSENFFMDAFEDFHARVYRVQTFMFRISASLNTAVYHFEKEQEQDQLGDRELLSSISHVWDITAKDTASKVKQRLEFQLGRQEFAEHVQLMLSREAATNVARLMERFESFMKDVFSALLCYDSARAIALNATIPVVVTSIDTTRQWVADTKIPGSPFGRQRANGSSIRKFLLREFPVFQAISKGDNNFNLDYDALMAVLILLRHDITHSEMVLGSKTMLEIATVQRYFSTVVEGAKTVLMPTEQQMRDVFDKVSEYAFAVAKFLSMQYKLTVADYTYSDKPAIMLMEGKIPIF